MKPEIKNYVRGHQGELLGLVGRVRFENGVVVYSAGTLPWDSTGSIKYGLRSYRDATDYADAEARDNFQHRCDDRCAPWPPED